jgi:hypothetical protein
MHGHREPLGGLQRLTVMMSSRLLVAIVAGGLAVAGCTSTAPATKSAPTTADTAPSQSSGSPSTSGRATSCGIPYQFTVNGRVVNSGSCAGQLGPTAPEVTVKVGERFSLQVAHDASGTPTFPTPQPSNGAVDLVGHAGSNATYEAVSPGNADLQAHDTPYCSATNPNPGTCAVLIVHVT